MTKTGSTTTPVGPTTSGTTQSIYLAWPSFNELADPIVESAYSLAKVDEQLPEVTVSLAGQVSAVDLAAVQLNQGSAYIGWQTAWGGLMGITEGYSVLGQPLLTEAHEPTGSAQSKDERSFEQLQRLGSGIAGRTARFGFDWIRTLTFSIFETSGIRKDTWGTLVAHMEGTSNIRRRVGEEVAPSTDEVEQTKMQLDYPNLARALRERKLAHLAAPVARRSPHAPEESLPVDVNWQVRFGASGDVADDDFERRPPLRNSLFED